MDLFRKGPKEGMEALTSDDLLEALIDDYTTHKQTDVIKMYKGAITKENFLENVKNHLLIRYGIGKERADKTISEFKEYIFGYGKLSSLIDDPDVSDIRCVSYDKIRVKRNGERMSAGLHFSSDKEYIKFVSFVATKNQANISNVNAIQRFTDTESHPDFILRFTVTMPLINTYKEPYLCIRKVPKKFPLMQDLIKMEVIDEETAGILIERFRSGSTLICGSNSSGKTTILNALKETLPENVSALVVQQADELTTLEHPDMMFLHSLPGSGESQVNYDLKHISIAGLTMDVDFFIVGEVKGEEAMYLLNAAYTGQTCAATVHALDATRAIQKIVDYAMYASKYDRNELMRMMDCFKTVIYMEKFKVKQVCSVEGWDEEQKEIRYIPIYGAEWIAEWTDKYKDAVKELSEGRKRAISLLEEEAANLNVIACDALAKLYEKGTLVATNSERSRKMYGIAFRGYMKCLEDPSPSMEAYINERIAIMYHDGIGTEPDQGKAYEYMKRAVQLGRDDSIKILKEWNSAPYPQKADKGLAVV